MISDYGGVEKVAPGARRDLPGRRSVRLSLPGLSPFVSEFLVLAGTFVALAVRGRRSRSFGIVLAALYILLMYQRTMTGPVREASPDIPDLNAARDRGAGAAAGC